MNKKVISLPTAIIEKSIGISLKLWKRPKTPMPSRNRHDLLRNLLGRTILHTDDVHLS